MNYNAILNDPTKIEGLTSEEKTNLYMRLKETKEKLTATITEQKAKKEMLENKKDEIQKELFEEAGVSNMNDLIVYVKKLQSDFDKALEEEATLVSSVMQKLNM